MRKKKGTRIGISLSNAKKITLNKR